MGLLLPHIVLLLATCDGCDWCGLGDPKTSPTPVIFYEGARGGGLRLLALSRIQDIPPTYAPNVGGLLCT